MKRSDFFSILFQKGAEWALDNPIAKVLEDYADETKKERPPGALPEKEFLKACTGCDACMKACPVNIIMIEDLERRDPVIYPEKKPCIDCKDTPCITSCPTGALILT